MVKIYEKVKWLKKNNKLYTFGKSKLKTTNFNKNVLL